MAYSSGNEELYFKTLREYKKLHGKDLEEIKFSLEAGNRKKACRQAHTLKSSSAFIGAEILSEIAFKAEKALKYSEQDNAAGVSRIMAELEEASQKLTAELECFSETEQPKIAFDKDRAFALMEKLIPLLETSEAVVFTLRDEIEEVFTPFGKEGEELLSLIDTFEFPEAAKVLLKIKSML